MSKTKVYLAKSNKANPNVVSMVRQLLSNYDVSVVEYTGGSYTDKPMLDCDFLVVIPEFPSSVVDLEYEIKQNFYHVCRNTFSLKTVVPKLESEYYVLIGRKI